MRSMRYFVPAIRDLAEVRKGRPIALLDDFRTSRAGLNLIGIEGVSMIADRGLDMAAWGRRCRYGRTDWIPRFAAVTPLGKMDATESEDNASPSCASVPESDRLTSHITHGPRPSEGGRRLKRCERQGSSPRCSRAAADRPERSGPQRRNAR
jgi:hypothetical protein